jgi:hypothetical protein
MSRRYRLAVKALVASSFLGAAGLADGCTDSVDDRLALEEPLRVGYFIGSKPFAAQFFPGDMPAANGGPAVAGVDIGPSQVAPGKKGKSGYTVRLAGSAFSVAIRLQGRTNGYWIARVNQVEALFDNQVSAALYFDVAPTMGTGPFEIELSGVDGDRRYGPRSTAPLTIVPRIPPDTVAAIHLAWDSPVDLDLQLRAPDGTFLSPKHPTTAPPGTPDAGTAPGYGHLDGDSMAGCVDDGFRQENVLFATAPNPGTYAVYVNAFDLCRQLGTNYEVSVVRNGVAQERYFGRISEPEVQQGGFGIGDFVANVVF